MSTRRFFCGFMVFVFVAVSFSESQAQRSGSTGGTSTFGNSGSSSSSQSFSNTGSSQSFSNSNTGSSRSSGNTGSSGGGTFGSATQSFTTFDSASGINSSTGNNRSGNNSAGNDFIGSSGNTFIGSSSSGAGTTTNRSSTGRNSMSSASTRNGNRASQSGGSGNTINRTQLQPVYVLGFTAPSPNFARVSSALSQRLDDTARTGRFRTMQIEWTSGTAHVRGTVASEHDRKVAENMVRLQPGISEINSDIQITDSTESPNVLSPFVRRRPQATSVPVPTTPQGQPLIHVF